jgi:hypothetical protein
MDERYLRGKQPPPEVMEKLRDLLKDGNTVCMCQSVYVGPPGSAHEPKPEDVPNNVYLVILRELDVQLLSESDVILILQGTSEQLAAQVMDRYFQAGNN